MLSKWLRHTDRDTADEAVSETFLVAWRRVREIPSEPLPWLLVVARNTLASQREQGEQLDGAAEREVGEFGEHQVAFGIRVGEARVSQYRAGR